MRLWPEFGWWRSWISFAAFFVPALVSVDFWKASYYSYQWEITKNPEWRRKLEAVMREA